MTTETETNLDDQAAALVDSTRNAILNLLHNHAAWDKLSEGKQRDCVHAAGQVAYETVSRAAHIIAARGLRSVVGTLQQVTVKDGLKLVVTAPKSVAELQRLVECQGSSIVIVLSDAAGFHATRTEPKIDHDEPELPLAGDTAEEAKVDEDGVVS